MTHNEHKNVVIYNILNDLINTDSSFSIAFASDLTKPEPVTYNFSARFRNQYPKLRVGGLNATLMIGGRPADVQVDFKDILQIADRNTHLVLSFSVEMSSSKPAEPVKDKIAWATPKLRLV